MNCTFSYIQLFTGKKVQLIATLNAISSAIFATTLTFFFEHQSFNYSTHSRKGWLRKYFCFAFHRKNIKTLQILWFYQHAIFIHSLYKNTEGVKESQESMMMMEMLVGITDSVVWVLSMSDSLNMGLQTMTVVVVVDNAVGSISFVQSVLALGVFTVSHFRLGFVVVGVQVLDSIFVFVFWVGMDVLVFTSISTFKSSELGWCDGG